MGTHGAKVLIRRLALLLVAVVPVLAACGATEVAPGEALAQARAKTAEVDTFRVWMTGATKIPGVGAIGFQGEGEFDNSARRGRMTMQLDEAGTLELVMDGLVLYMREEGPAGGLPQAKPWLKIDLGRAGDALGLDLGAVMQLGQQQNPAQSLDQLRAAGDVEPVGGEVVRGVETTHYRATIDLLRQVSLVEEESPAAAAAIRQAISLTGQRRVAIEVWIGEDELVRRMKWTQRLPAGDRQGSMTVLMELYDFGGEVAVELPPSDQVTSLEELGGTSG